VRQIFDDEHLFERMWTVTITRPDKVSDHGVGFWLCAVDGELRSNLLRLKWCFPLLRGNDHALTVSPLQPHLSSVDNLAFHQWKFIISGCGSNENSRGHKDGHAPLRMRTV
jgi:hypothetical protein